MRISAIQHLPLIWKIIIACVLGIALGNVLPLGVVRIFATFNAIFSQFIGYLVPLIILGLVTPAICQMGGKASRLLLFTVALAYTSTVLAGLFSYSVCSHVFPQMLQGMSLQTDETVSTSVQPYFTVTIPALMDVMTALVSSFMFGIFLTLIQNDHLKQVVYDFKEVVTLAISRIMIPLLPLYIFGILLKMTYTGEAMPILRVFSVVILIIFAMSIVWLLILFTLAGSISRKHPLRSLVTMLQAYVTALGTSSSAAAIPVTLEQVVKCGVKREVAGFTVPLCSTIHMPGSCIKIVACAITIMIVQGMDFDFSLMLGFITLLAITMVAAPGVPGGCIMAALGVLSSVLGFSETDQALMIALYVVMDSFGTACNVTGDGAISMVVDKYAKL